MSVNIGKTLYDKFEACKFKLCEILGIVLPYPYAVMIEPTNSCNLHCPACPTGSGKMNRPIRNMSYEEFKKIIDQCRNHTRDVILWNFGEPFLNKEILKMIDYACHADMNVTTSTNGHFFRSEEFCLEIVKSGLQHLIICLDGADQDTVSKYRKNARFDDIINGIKLLNMAKVRLSSKTPKIELRFILMKHNEYQRYYMKELASQLRVDLYTEKMVGIGQDRSDSEFQNLAKELLPEDLSSSRYYLNKDGAFVPKGKIVNTCSFIYRTIVINSNGTVIPCCYDESSNYIMGNIFEEDIKTIWKKDIYQNFRKQVRKDRKVISLCSKCSENRNVVKKR